MPYRSKEERAAYQRAYRARKRTERKPEGVGPVNPGPEAGAGTGGGGVNPDGPRPMLGMSRQERLAELRRRMDLHKELLSKWLEAERAWKREQSRLTRDVETRKLRERMRAAQEMLRPLQEACRERERAEEEERERRFRARTARLPERREKLEERIAEKHAQMAAAWREAVQRERAERAKGS